MINFNIYRSVNQLPKSWDSLPHHDLFLKIPFLKALENSAPENISSFYISIFKSDILVGIVIIQRVEMYLEDIFRNTNDSYLIRKSKSAVSQIVKGNALIIGNIMHTGQHGLYFNNTVISYADYLEQIALAIDEIKLEIKQKHKKTVRIIAFKDYFEDDAIHENQRFFDKRKLYKVQVQPNMVFSIPEHWDTFEAYISSFKKKYRDRYKSARKKANSIIKKELSVLEVKRLENELYPLYLNVSDNARVNSFILNSNHFSTLKEELQDNFRVYGYFLNEELVGFFTLIQNNSILETYFLGYNHNLQHKHQMYLNMLFDMAQFGIENKFNSIVYARTAIEIKSSIGAKPKPMHIYMKHTNYLANATLKLIVKYLNPVKEWTERHPFK